MTRKYTTHDLEPDKSSEFPIMPTNDWCDRELADPGPPWLLTGMVMPKGLTIVGGREKVGKSFQAQTMAMAMSSGRKIGLFDPVGRSSSLFIDLEGSARMTAERIQFLMKGYDLARADLAHMFTADTRQFALLEDRGAAKLCGAVKEHGIQTVILDTFAASFNGDENGKKDVQKYLNALSVLRQETQCATVLVHHVNKASFSYREAAVRMDPSSGLRGNSAIAAGYDVVLSCQDGVVDGEFKTFMVSGGKHTAVWWAPYKICGEQNEAEEWTKSWVQFGQKHKELAYIERGLPSTQPEFGRYIPRKT